VKLADKKMIETKDLKEKNQSNCLNQNLMMSLQILLNKKN
jgi:hypothetical protein